MLKGKKQSASELMPLVHMVASLLKRWLLGTHQGAVSREHLDYYLDEFTFGFNRRSEKPRQAVLPTRATGGRSGTGALQSNGQVLCRGQRGKRGKPQPVVATFVK